MGYPGEVYADGEALTHLDELSGRWELVISGLVMPRVGGLELPLRMQ